MKKYIIKNCPNLVTSYYATRDEKVENECGLEFEQFCKDICEKCLLKQIVEKCKENYGNENHRLADKILSLLEIEEVNAG